MDESAASAEHLRQSEGEGQADWLIRVTEAFKDDPRIEPAEALVECLRRSGDINTGARITHAVEVTALLLRAPGTAREESRYRELAQEAADLCPDDTTKAILWTHIAEYLPPAQRASAMQKARDSLTGEGKELPNAFELFGDKAFGRGEAYV
ncbi:MAG TPA: hypothetical protein VIF43_00495 [Patescibacteria group bacterium]|jgi:hypothetical protein